MRVTIIVLFMMSLIGALAPAPASADGDKGVTATVTVNAPQVRCWDVIIAQRTAEPDKRKIISQEGDKTFMKETYDNLPVIGDAYLEYEEIATPHTMLEAHLVKSDKFKAFDSKWTLTPTTDGKGTTISLYTYLNTGLWIPFAQQITNRNTRQDITERLEYIKKLAEAGQ